MLNTFDDLSPNAIDCLKEIGNIGSGSAAASLSMMVGQTVEMHVPDVKVLDYNEVMDCMGGPEKVITGILVPLEGDVNGVIMFLLEESFAKVVLDAFMPTDRVELVKLDSTQSSAITEVGNIMAGAYISALSTLTGLHIGMQVPSMTIDMLGAIMTVPIIEFAAVGDKVLFIDDGFAVNGNDIKSNIILVPEMDSLATLMKRLGVL